MPFVIEKLLVYRRAVDFADRALALTERFPRGYRFLADQLNRASASIAANIAEGNGRFTKADRKHFFGIARARSRRAYPFLISLCVVGLWETTCIANCANALMSRPE